MGSFKEGVFPDNIFFLDNYLGADSTTLIDSVTSGSDVETKTPIQEWCERWLRAREQS